MNSAAWWAIGAVGGAVAWLPAARVTVMAIAEREPARYVPSKALVAAGAVCSGLVAATFGLHDRRAEFLAYAGFMVAMVVLAVIDAFTLKLPRGIVWTTFAWGVFTLTPIAIRDGDQVHIVRAAAGSVVAAAAVWVFRVATRGGVGFGDVRLAVAIGWFDAWQSWPTLGRAGLIAVLVNAAISIVLLATKRAGRRTKVPFGPSLAIGAAIAVLLA